MISSSMSLQIVEAKIRSSFVVAAMNVVTMSLDVLLIQVLKHVKPNAKLRVRLLISANVLKLTVTS